MGAMGGIRPGARGSLSNPGLTWITGGSSGIGAALARELAKRKHQVAISARRDEALREVAAESDQIDFYSCDITDPTSVKDAVETLSQRHGQIDRAVLNAGSYIPDGWSDGLEIEKVRKQHALNFLGTLNCIEALLPQMTARKSGHIVLVASVAGYRGLPRSLGYSSSKAALIALGESMRLELEQVGIRVQVCCPGFVRTELTDKNDFPMPMMMEVADAAESFADQMLSDDFRITFPKTFTWLMRRLRNMPDSLYFALARKGVIKA